MTVAKGAVIGNGMIPLYDGIGASDRDDILDCLSHADGFASRVFDQKMEYHNWLFRYRTRLQQRGWDLINPVRHTPQVIFDAKELNAVSYRVFESVASRTLARLAQSAWSSMSTNRPPRAFFRAADRDGELGRMQLMPCVLEPDGDIMMLAYCIRLTGTVDTRDFDFWTQTRREMLLRISGGVYRFDRQVYARFRDEIRTQLGNEGDRGMQFYYI